MRHQPTKSEELAEVLNAVVLLVALFGIRHDTPVVIWAELGLALLGGAGLLRHWPHRRSSRAAALYGGACCLGLLCFLVFSAANDPGWMQGWRSAVCMAAAALMVLVWRSGVPSLMQKAMEAQRLERPVRQQAQLQEVAGMWEPGNRRRTVREFALGLLGTLLLFGLLLLIRRSFLL